jgi:hypothetical protein
MWQFWRRAVWMVLTQVLVVHIAGRGVRYSLANAFFRVTAKPWLYLAHCVLPKETRGLKLPSTPPTKTAVRGNVIKLTPLMMSAMLKEPSYPEGVLRLNAALKAQHVDSRTSNLLATHACIKLGRSPEAIALAELSLQQGEDAAEVYYCEALAWFRAGDLKQSAHYRDRARKLSPDHRGVQALIRHQQTNGTDYTPDMHIVPSV